MIQVDLITSHSVYYSYLLQISSLSKFNKVMLISDGELLSTSTWYEYDASNASTS